MTRNVNGGLNGTTPSAPASTSARSVSRAGRSDTMSSDRGMVRGREMGELVGTEAVGRERVSTERGTEKVSTEPPGILKDANVGVPLRKHNTNIPYILPHERVFPIQIGSELFRLSGASLSSDGMWPFSSP